MKNIGIVTFHNANNYGAVLQTYALYQFLTKNKGYNVSVLDYNNKSILKEYKLISNTSLKSLIKSILILNSSIQREH